jgi:hypothetical protein
MNIEKMWIRQRLLRAPTSLDALLACAIHNFKASCRSAA